MSAQGAGAWDAGLRLLDRQVVDVDGRAVGKVDDIELTLDPDGGLVVTGLLLGLAALLPRLGRRAGPALAALHRRAGVSEAARRRPAAVDLADVVAVDSAVHLAARREDLLLPRLDDGDAPTAVRRHRVGDLLGLPVVRSGAGAGRRGRAARVLDVRLAPGVAGPDGPPPRVVALVVGPSRPGPLLGYGPGEVRVHGPRLLAALVGHLHRHAVVVPVDDVRVEWDDGRVELIAPTGQETPG